MGSRGISTGKKIFIHLIFLAHVSFSAANVTNSEIGNYTLQKDLNAKNVLTGNVQKIIEQLLPAPNNETMVSDDNYNASKYREAEEPDAFLKIILSDEDISKESLDEKKKKETLIDASKYIASVRHYPTELHCCSASFIAKDTLITSAKCIYRLPVVNTFVHALSNLLETTGVSVPVSEFSIHPEFELRPSSNNIGLIKLMSEVMTVSPLLLPSFLPSRQILYFDDVIVYGWTFTLHATYFYLKEAAGTFLSNVECELILQEQLNCKTEICASNTVLSHGSYDEGLPLTYKHDGKLYIVGLYNRNGIVSQFKVDKYEKIVTHEAWINSSMRNLSADDSIYD